MGIRWKYSARAMRVIWFGNGVLFVGIVFLYFAPVVTMVLAPIATGITLYGISSDRGDKRARTEQS